MGEMKKEGKDNIHTLIFDLSEVLISGLIGIEIQLAELTGKEKEEVVKSIEGPFLNRLFIGEISEEQYLDHLLADLGESTSRDTVIQIIRNNFHNSFKPMIDLVLALRGKYRLILLSDHAREWINYIKEIHAFIDVFDYEFYSFELGQTKKSSTTFVKVLEQIDCPPEHCLFIDDSEENIYRAKIVGINGIRFNGKIFDLLNQLKYYGVRNYGN